MIPETVKQREALWIWNDLCTTVAGVDGNGNTVEQISDMGLILRSHGIPICLSASHVAQIETLAARLEADAEVVGSARWKHSFEDTRVKFERVAALWSTCIRVDPRFLALLTSHGASSAPLAVPDRREEIGAGAYAFAEFMRSFASALRRAE